MASFLPRSLQARLLRYALSRIDLFDVDTLILDSLDIGWRTPTTVRLSNVAIRKDRLAALLSLPEPLKVTAASVDSFVLTLPTNLYTYPIHISLSGVRITAIQEGDASAGSPRPSDRHSPPSPQERFDSTHTEDDGNDEHLPTTFDLAQSFLEQAQPEEKAQLQAEVTTQSVELAQSSASLDNDEEALGYGYAEGLSLPAFLTSFLSAVLDRMIVTVEDVVIEAGFSPPGPGQSQQNTPRTIYQARVAVRIRVDRLCSPGAGLNNIRQAAANGITTAALPDPASAKASKRLIEISDLSMSMLSSQAIFEAWDKLMDRDEVRKDRVSPIHSWAESHARGNDSSRPRGARGAATDPGPTSRQAGFGTDDDSRGAIDEARNTTELIGSQSSGKHRFSSASQPDNGADGPQLNDSLPGSSNLLDPSMRQRVQSSESLLYEGGQSVSSGPFFASLPSHAVPNQPKVASRTPQHEAHVFSNANSFSPESPQEGEQLLESTLFTPQEAESLYLSVLEQGTPLQQEFAPEQTTAVSELGRRNYEADLRDVGISRAESQDLDAPSRSQADKAPQSRSDATAGPDQSDRVTISDPDDHIVSKDLVLVDRISIWLAGAGHAREAVDSFSDSVRSQNDPQTNVMPGTFSIHKESISPTTHASLDSSLLQNLPSHQQQPRANGSEKTDIDVECEEAIACADLSLCAMLSQFLQHVSNMFEETKVVEVKNAKNDPSLKKTDASGPHFHAAIAGLKVVLKDRVSASDPADGPVRFLTEAAPKSSVVLLEIVSKSIEMRRDTLGVNTLNIGNFALKLVGQEVLRIDRTEPALALAKNSQSIGGDALSMTIVQKAAATEVNITSSAIHVDVDPFQLDENLAMLGGFSGLIGVGSLVLSETSMANLPRASAAQIRPKNVRFEPAPVGSKLAAEEEQLKLNIRLGSTAVQLRGRGHSITCETSAVKLVHRTQLLGMQIDRISLNWPSKFQGPNSTSCSIGVHNVGLKYLPSPEEQDLAKLVGLVAPSSDRFDGQDDLLLGTLVQQRRNGAVARLSCSQIHIEAEDHLPFLSLGQLGKDLASLSNISKYLPKESRPGMLMVGSVTSIDLSMTSLGPLGSVNVGVQHLEFAHIGSPLLIASTCGRVDITRNSNVPVIRPVISQDPPLHPFMLMLRFVGEEVNPTARIKMFNTCLEYSASLVPDVQELINLHETQPQSESRSGRNLPDNPKREAALGMSVELRDCSVGLSPHAQESKAVVLLTDALLSRRSESGSDVQMLIVVKKSSMLLVNDVSVLRPIDEANAQKNILNQSVEGIQLARLSEQGFVTVAWLSAANVDLIIPDSASSTIQIDISDPLLVMETCPDSTQTLSSLFGGLTPVQSSKKTLPEYNTEIAPLPDMMASFSGDAFALPPQYSSKQDVDSKESSLVGSSASIDSLFPASPRIPALAMDASFEDDKSLSEDVEAASSFDFAESERSTEILSGGLNIGVMPAHASRRVSVWDSKTNRFIPARQDEAKTAINSVNLRNAHLIWNLYDGYDWPATRDAIAEAAQELEKKVMERRSKQHVSGRKDDDSEPVINDFLFNSIYIGIPANREARELSQQISRQVDDFGTDTTSIPPVDAAEQPSSGPSKAAKPRSAPLKRSNRQKLAIELRGISVESMNFRPQSATTSSAVLSVQDFEIFDHVPTSTWKKFATYQSEMGGREERKSMAKIEMCTVRPNPDLPASELVIRVTILPLRLHIDQDALDFMTRFFEFRDEQKKTQENESAIYLQRVEILPVAVKLDYKPKKVDFAGLSSGRTKEFMNFFNLDGADITLKHAIVYGCRSFARLQQSLEDVWMPDIKRNQLPGILSGLNGVRTLVNVGGGFKNLLVIPVQEYQKDGQVVRSISRGASAFVKTTGSELTKFGARVAVGAHNVLQGAENLLGTQGLSEDFDPDILISDPSMQDVRRPPEGPPAHSNFSDQPAGFLQGLKSAARSLERDLLLTRDVLIAVSGEVRESGSAEGAARAVVRHAPTLVLRPMIGASKAISQTLMGVTNAVDPDNRRRMDEKYKSH